MLNYDEIEALTNHGINEFSGGAKFEMITSGGGVEIVNGEEITKPEIKAFITGAVRAVSYLYIDGSSVLAGDKRGFFTNDVPIENGMIVILKGEHWRVVDNRPVEPKQDGHVIAYRPILRRVAAYG